MSRQQGSTATPYYTPPQPSTPSGVRATLQAARSAPKSKQPMIGQLWERAWKTLKGQFFALAVLIMLVAIVQAVLVSLSFKSAYDDLDTIHNGSVPSVDAAQQIAQYLDDIDARSADYLATGGLTQLAPCTLPTTNQTTQLSVHDCDDQTIDAEIALTNRQLFNATHNVTYVGEQTAVERVTAGLEEYIGHITVMRNEYNQALSKSDPKDQHLMNAYNEYKAANDVLLKDITHQPLTSAKDRPTFYDDNVVLPDCKPDNQPVLQPSVWVRSSLQVNIECLSFINKQLHLDVAYSDSQALLGRTILQVGFFCLLFSLLLVIVGIRMMTITHRIINIGLTLAALISITFSISSVAFFVSMAGDHGSFGQIVNDDYKSIYYAALLKRDGTNANADESRWLIALTFGDQSAASRWQEDWQINTQHVEELMTNAQANRTWIEEDQPLADMKDGWSRYFFIDGQIRSAANANHLVKAESLSTGESNTAFSKFTNAVDALSQANRGHYDGTFQSVQGDLQLYIYLSAILFPLIGLCAVWGISQRMKDF